MTISTLKNSLIAGGLMLGFAASMGAQQTNEQDRKDAVATAKQDRAADKAQAKADKSEKKLAKSKKAKKAARDQDKADEKADQVPK